MSSAPPDLSDSFFTRWALMCQRLDVAPLDLMRVAYSESSVRANAHNPHGDAVGLIQFMPATLLGLGWTRGWQAFSQLPADEQVSYVERYFRPWAHRMGIGGQSIPQLTSDALCYVATFLPSCLAGAVAAGEGAGDYVLCAAAGPMAWAYAANKVLDRDGDGAITVGDLARHLEIQCRGARYDAIAYRLARANGENPPPLPDPVPTEKEIPCIGDEDDD